LKPPIISHTLAGETGSLVFIATFDMKPSLVVVWTGRPRLLVLKRGDHSRSPSGSHALRGRPFHAVGKKMTGFHTRFAQDITY
jgi:hypothetical protein